MTNCEINIKLLQNEFLPKIRKSSGLMEDMAIVLKHTDYANILFYRFDF
ncbi:MULTISPECIES: hypothetical protein [Sporomusa]